MPQYSFNGLTDSGTEPFNPALDGISFVALQEPGIHLAYGYDGVNFYAYLWDPTNTDPENPPFVIIPNDRPGGSDGAFIQLTLSSGIPSHASTHQNGGADQISLAGLSGEAADPQPPKAHASSHVGSDSIQDASGSQKGLATAAQIQTLTKLATLNVKIYYVGKHGNDSTNGGKIDPDAFLTFGKAITEALAQTPSDTNRFVIRCRDAGIYSENITCAEFVSIDAPNAEINGTVDLHDNMIFKAREVSGVSSGIAVEKPSGQTGTTIAYVEKIDVTGAATGCANNATAGVLMLNAKQIFFDTGVGVGATTGTLGHMHIDIGDIYIRGNNGTALERDGAGTMLGKVDHILELGSPTGTTGVSVLGGQIDVNIRCIVADTAYNIAASATFSAFINDLTGSRINAGTDNTIVATDLAIGGLQYAESEGQSDDDTDVYKTKLTLNTGLIEAGDYRVGWFFQHTVDDEGAAVAAYKVVADEGGGGEQDVMPEINLQPYSVWDTCSGFRVITFTEDTHDIKIMWHGSVTKDPNTASIKNARLELRRVS